MVARDPADKYQRLLRAYMAHQACQKIVHEAEAEEEMFQRFCTVASEELGYTMAWVGLRSQADEIVHPVAFAGMEADYLNEVVIACSADSPHGHGPTGRAIRHRKSQVSQNILEDPDFEPWRQSALERGYASSVAIPLFDGPSPVGALNLYASEAHAFDKSEIALLEEVALDLQLGMRHHRMNRRLAEFDQHIGAISREEAAFGASLAITHDMANVLSVAHYALELLEASPTEKVRNAAVVDLRSAVDTAIDLLDHVRSLARRTESSASPLALATALQGNLRLLRRLVPHCEFEAHIPESAARVCISAVDLERLLINLIVNAGHAVPEGGTIRLDLALVHCDEDFVTSTGSLPAGSYARIDLSDSGNGIQEDVLPHIFETFFSTKGEFGTGLGLPTVLASVRAAGGEIQVHTRIGEGTTFQLYLPVVRHTKP